MAERAPLQPTIPIQNNSGPRSLPNRWTWARGRITSFKRGVFSRPLSHQPLFQNPFPSPTRKLPKSLVTATRKTARLQKSERKFTAAPKLAAGKSQKKADANVKSAAAKPTTPNLVVQNQSSTSPLEEISDLLDLLPLHAYVELTCRLPISFSLPTGAASPRAVLKTVVLFVAEYGFAT